MPVEHNCSRLSVLSKRPRISGYILLCLRVMRPVLLFFYRTTTPWTLPSNLALCVNKKLTYMKIKGTSFYWEFEIGIGSVLHSSVSYQFFNYIFVFDLWSCFSWCLHENPNDQTLAPNVKLCSNITVREIQMTRKYTMSMTHDGVLYVCQIYHCAVYAWTAKICYRWNIFYSI